MPSKRKDCTTCYYAEKRGSRDIKCQYFEKEHIPVPAYVGDHTFMHPTPDAIACYMTINGGTHYTGDIVDCPAYRRNQD